MAEFGKGEIVIHHINIRQSIAILLAKVVTIDVISASLIGAAYFIVTTTSNVFGYQLTFNLINLSIFLFIASSKVALTIYVVLTWLNEYYEITPEYVFHRRGIIYKSEEKIKLTSVDAIQMEQGLLGKMLNYGGISLHSYLNDQLMSLYLIHNPGRYHSILGKLIPKSDDLKRSVGGDFLSGNIDRNKS